MIRRHRSPSPISHVVCLAEYCISLHRTHARGWSCWEGFWVPGQKTQTYSWRHRSSRHMFRPGWIQRHHICLPNTSQHGDSQGLLVPQCSSDVCLTTGKGSVWSDRSSDFKLKWISGWLFGFAKHTKKIELICLLQLNIIQGWTMCSSDCDCNFFCVIISPPSYMFLHKHIRKWTWTLITAR